MSCDFLRKTITEELGYTPDPELFEHILKEMLKDDGFRAAVPAAIRNDISTYAEQAFEMIFGEEVA
jgi:hypothetical protein